MRRNIVPSPEPIPSWTDALRPCEEGTATPAEAGCYRFQDWLIAPEGGVIHQSRRTAVIADVHLGYEWARGFAGDCVPAHSLADTLARLEGLLQRSAVTQLVVAGDLVESSRPCAGTARDLEGLLDWLADRGVRLRILRGNHDRGLRGMLESMMAPPGRCGAVEPRDHLVVAGWTIAHGDRPVSASRIILGHHHPCMRWEGRSSPCFLVAAHRIVLPAFSANAAGCDVLASGPGAEDDWRAAEAHCLCGTGERLFDFGPLARLGRSERSARSLRCVRGGGGGPPAV